MVKVCSDKKVLGDINEIEDTEHLINVLGKTNIFDMVVDYLDVCDFKYSTSNFKSLIGKKVEIISTNELIVAPNEFRKFCEKPIMSGVLAYSVIID